MEHTGLLLNRGNPALDGEFDKTRQILDAELLHEVASVGFNCLGRQKENLGYPFVCLTFDEELEDFPFTGG